MKLIDVLVMISKGELKEGTKVKCPKNGNESVWVFRIRDGYNRLIDEEEHYYLDPVFFINEEVELIEPECEHEWAKYSLGRLGGWTEFRRRCKKCGVDEEEPTDNTTEKIEELVADEINGKSLAEALSIIGGKLNEVIRYINKEE